MLFILMLNPPQPYDWTTDAKVLAWIAVASLIMGVLGIVIGFGGGYWFYQKGKNWHRVIYEIISDTPIVLTFRLIRSRPNRVPRFRRET